MLKDLIKLANHLDSKGLTKEADIVDNIANNIANKYREGGKELSNNIKNVVDNAKNNANRDDFDKAVDYSNKNIERERKAIAERELGKTAEWFKKTVIPSIRENRWPIVADQDYHTNYYLNDFSMIRKGSSFSDTESSSSNSRLSLKDYYEKIKDAINQYDLRIRLDENLLEKIDRKVTDIKTNIRKNRN